MKKSTTIVLIFMLLSCEQNNNNSEASNLDRIDALKTLDEKLSKPQYGEWLFVHKEKGQTFKKYRTISPVSPSENKNIIYLQPLGNFTPVQFRVLEYTANYIEIFFSLKTVLCPTISDSIIPSAARRIDDYGNEQLNSLYILDSFLLQHIPAKAVVIMAFTSKDLFPQSSWNYVFGQANTTKRVGVSSLFRYSEPTMDSSNYNVCLERLIKTSAHEIGHMFTIKHCINAHCLMNGSNHLEESDRKPNHLCSECLKKLYWNLQFNLQERNDKLVTFFQTHKLTQDLTYFKRASEILKR